MSTPVAVIAPHSRRADRFSRANLWSFVPQSGPVEGCHTFSGHSPFEQVCRRLRDAGSVAFCTINRPSRSAFAAPQTDVMMPICAGAPRAETVCILFAICTHSSRRACLFCACKQAQGSLSVTSARAVYIEQAHPLSTPLPLWSRRRAYPPHVWAVVGA